MGRGRPVLGLARDVVEEFFHLFPVGVIAPHDSERVVRIADRGPERIADEQISLSRIDPAELDEERLYFAHEFILARLATSCSQREQKECCVGLSVCLRAGAACEGAFQVEMCTLERALFGRLLQVAVEVGPRAAGQAMERAVPHMLQPLLELEDGGEELRTVAPAMRLPGQSVMLLEELWEQLVAVGQCLLLCHDLSQHGECSDVHPVRDLAYRLDAPLPKAHGLGQERDATGVFTKGGAERQLLHLDLDVVHGAPHAGTELRAHVLETLALCRAHLILGRPGAQMFVGGQPGHELGMFAGLEIGNVRSLPVPTGTQCPEEGVEIAESGVGCLPGVPGKERAAVAATLHHERSRTVHTHNHLTKNGFAVRIWNIQLAVASGKNRLGIVGH
ncbi:MAG: hypothetical protein QG626_11 [Patescibacteria group bacterium]|nr:hypothetical protein [Patescibacteria group bacterium]